MAKKYIEYDNKKFPNESELEFYQLIQSLGLVFYHQKKILLLDATKNGKDVHWNVDFHIPHLNIVIDTKGCDTNMRVAELKRRLLEDRYPGMKALFVYKHGLKWLELVLGTKFISEEERAALKKVTSEIKLKYNIKTFNSKNINEDIKREFISQGIKGIFGCVM